MEVSTLIRVLQYEVGQNVLIRLHRVLLLNLCDQGTSIGYVQPQKILQRIALPSTRWNLCAVRKRWNGLMAHVFMYQSLSTLTKA